MTWVSMVGSQQAEAKLRDSTITKREEGRKDEGRKREGSDGEGRAEEVNA